MHGKVHDGTTRVLAVVYGTRALAESELTSVCEHLAALLREHAGATSTQLALVPA
jgi:DNA/RNA-binding domain of Phe-tRNA-synthetase-like protein